MRDGVATLISVTYKKDALSQNIRQETEEEIFVTEESISRTEWTAATGGGYNPEITLRTQAVNYSKQKTCVYEGERYNIYRTYPNGDEIYLYLEKTQGDIRNGE